MSRSPDQTLTYQLAAADSFAWESRPREMTGWRRALFLLWLGLAGFVLVLVPKNWVGPEEGWRFYLWLVGLIAVQWALAALSMTLMARWRARRRFPEPVTVRLDVFADRLVERRDLADPVVLTPDRIAAVLLQAGHVVLASNRDVVIVPLRAFADPEAMRAFATQWDGLSRAAHP